MPKRGAISLVITGIALVLLLNFKTPDAVATLGTGTGTQPIISTPAATSQTGTGTTTGNSTSNGSTASASTGSTSNGTTTSTKSGTITGSAVQTPYGPVQIQVTLSNGKITNVQAVQYPSYNGHSLRISQYAIPTLIQETLSAQSAQINGVSGATYTSQGYMQSLQSALDQARG